jgi:hypothetical protein
VAVVVAMFELVEAAAAEVVVTAAVANMAEVVVAL